MLLNMNFFYLFIKKTIAFICKEKKFFLKGLSAEKARSGLTYNELAERSGLPIGRIHRFAEQRQAATWQEAQKIADFLGCPVESLRPTE